MSYQKNHSRIFGEHRSSKLTPAQIENNRRMARERHNKLAADGKKDAQYYLDNEQRVSSNPNYQPFKPPSPEYLENWDNIYGG